MTSTLPLSVLMSVNNAELYLTQTLDSILCQSFTNYEFIIVNDASTDGTARILEDYARREPRIRLLFNSKNLGLAFSLNRGLEQARGQYIARMDADDISLPFRLEKQLAFMERHPEVGVLGTAVKLIDSAGQVTGQRMYPPEPIIIRWRLAIENPICHPTIMMRRDLLHDVQYNADLTTAQDYDLWCQLSPRTRLANLPEPLLYFRKHSAALTYQKGEQQRANSLQISNKYLEHLLKMPMSEEVVGYLWERKSLSLKQALEVATVMEYLAGTILAETSWSDSERKALRRHAAGWIFERARKEMGKPLAWQIVWKSAKLDPLNLPQRLVGRFIPATVIPR